ncbi:putative non-specific serine/threonine protein kinase [Helianthus annuus]|uniref:Non-specific serine/threonine protein kinase n=1 Tax=Helianthus annuus TaxID=4232 RepID=A0A251RS51_HELAN|nr:putative non-specific serine/threonine protein kinase [Helianthus annuus]KAJ0428402.1 putative non-specific serine/threonine protein kinase [Helianthus annuus]KAJ0432483.1 putative non-specific serine/threonine protein kinase [Helianthus annuus]KAJ0635538.1 putative non-specific serine/threonine protein kinase [Helianthus annuus]KAJ0812267.1 putative non-specific serine/threonine protein kinase [Helianthus annuus]
MRLNYIYNFSFFSDENVSYFTYSLYNPSIISRFVMSVSGQVQQLTWLDETKQWNLFWSQPRTQCEVYDLCGAFGTCRQTGLPFCNCLTGFKPKSENDWNQSDFSSGCVRKTDLECGNNKEISFLMVKVDSVPPNFVSMAIGGDGECRAACLNSCQCNA